MRELLHLVYPICVANEGKDIGYGSGFITSDKYLRTAWHVLVDPTRTLKSRIINSNGMPFDISPNIHKNIDYDQFEYKNELPESVAEQFKKISIANSKPKIGCAVHIAGIRNTQKPISIIATIIKSKYEKFLIKVSTEADYHGFSGGLVANTNGEAVGIINGQLGEKSSNYIFCQFITPDKYI